MALALGGNSYVLTARDQSGNISPAVNITITRNEIPEVPPSVSGLQLGNQPLSAGTVVTASGMLGVTATSEVGISRVEFYLDGQLLASDNSGSDSYRTYWDLSQVTDGSHTLRIKAISSTGLESDLTVSVVVALAVPAVPQITSPINGLLTAQATQAVLGGTEINSQVQLYLNDQPMGAAFDADANGHFNTSIQLIEGENRLQASAINRVGESAQSQTVTVTLDSSLPAAPIGLRAVTLDSGRIALSWLPVAGDITGYNLYRHTATFDTAGQAVKINQSLLSSTEYEDLPAVDGTYYYRVSAVNKVGTEGDLSDAAYASVDRTPPRALDISYLPLGHYDAVNNRYAQGRVEITVTVSEPLLTIPFLSWVVDGGAPVAAVLEKFSENEYRGYIDITQAAGSGTAYAIFSAHDTAGNRGTVVESGGQIEIDTKGPEVVAIQLDPAHPIKNNQTNPVTLAVTLQLDEPLAVGQQPDLGLTLPLSGGSVSVDNFSTTDRVYWQGSARLTAEAGLAAPELLLFDYQGVDALGNESTRIQDAFRPQVYQGDLPPLAVPAQCTAEALPNGAMQLNWQAVDEASDYRIYRKAPGETALTPHGLSGGQLSFQEAPGADGDYEYAVASVRQANGETAYSAPCASQHVTIDSITPVAPSALTLSLIGAGIEAKWVHAEAGEGITYRLYRDSLSPITAVDQLTPVRDEVEVLSVIDSNPTVGFANYVVTAVDHAGNESLPSNTAYLNFELLPISQFTIVKPMDQPPELSWVHKSATIDHYDLYLADPQLGFKLNDMGLTGTAYQDLAAGEQERLYTVVAVDNVGAESVGRSLLLPQLEINPPTELLLKRGTMNRLSYTLTNHGQHAIRNAQLKVTAAGNVHQSQPFDLAAGQSTVVSVVVGGYQSLGDTELLQAQVEIRPNDDELVQIHHEQTASVSDAGLTVGLAVQNMIRGGSGEVRFTLENSSDVELELITARANGANPSDQVLVKLLDEDENVLATAPLHQLLGDVITLSNGTTVARIAAGEHFTSDWTPIIIPQASPDQITVQLDISALHYQLGHDTQVSIAGVSGRRDVPLLETPYYGAVDSITPALSYGDQPITISGRALVRSDDTPLGYAPLNLVLSINGFERVIEVMTGDNGQFSIDYTPQPHETGTFTVAATHPDLVERPEQGRFVVGGVRLQYDLYKLRTAKHYDQAVSLNATASDGVGFQNLRFELRLEDQPSGSLPTGITLTPGSSLTLSAGQSAPMSMTLSADTDAPETGEFVVRVVSDEVPDRPLDTLIVSYRLVDASAQLRFEPSSLMTGVAPGDRISEVLTLSNKGLLPAENVTLSLINNDDLDWVSMNTPAQVGRLDLGDTYEVGLTFAPEANVPPNVYEIGVAATANGEVLATTGISVTVSAGGEGWVQFKIEDIYTGTKDDNGMRIEGLEGAKISLQHELLSTVHESFISGVGGEVLTSLLPAGSYRYRITAPDHVEATGRLAVRAGVVSNERIFLDSEVVTVHWSVTETTIQDLYNITLTATYAVNVPTAVIALEPASISLPYLKAGDVYYGELALTNYGLIRADDVQLELPPEDEYLRVEALIDNLPTTLAPKQRVVIPYRITAVKNLEADVTGGGCFSYSNSIKAKASSECANGDTANRSSSTAITHRSGGSCGGNGDDKPDEDIGNGWGDVGGFGGPEGNNVVPSGMPACRPVCNDCSVGGRGGE
ncbi:MAG: Ig-like domain-containing protein [Chromatiales bacterium]|nr:Ig-like domain-containing protein [Chromatiales bacterium]